jgi:hypothetical protein
MKIAAARRTPLNFSIRAVVVTLSSFGNWLDEGEQRSHWQPGRRVQTEGYNKKKLDK